jgi:predicted permease
MLFNILVKQIMVMTLLTALGLILSRKRMLSESSTKELGTILLRVVIPCIIIKSCITEYTPEKSRALAVSFVITAGAFLISHVIAYAACGTRRRLDNFAAASCNAGFIGIPLVQAVFGETGVFYAIAAVAVVNILQWTYGVFIITGKKEAVSPRTIIRNPVVIAVITGLLVFYMRIPVPEVVVTALSAVGSINTPVAMILLGTYMAKLTSHDLLNSDAVLPVILRLIVIPAATLLFLVIIPGAADIKMAVLLMAVTPVPTGLCVYAQQFDQDYAYCVIPVCLSTIFSVITVPAVFAIAERLL